MKASERKFEGVIEAWLLEHGGYRKGDSRTFDRALGLDPGEVLAFVHATQKRAWDALAACHGGEAAAATNFLRRLARELDERGTVDMLRHGVKDLGVEIRLASFKPAHGLTPELVERYEANRLALVRQLAYAEDGTKTIDLAILLNGIPVATSELKNPLTGQTVEHAKAQYRRDRDPPNVTLGRRAVVHFAVDPDEVAMTTRLAGAGTQFLPFNRGSEEGDAANPLNPRGHKTAYLWEDVWQRDNWLDLLACFVQVERPDKGSAAERRAKTRIIFPRFHQWDAVRRLEAHAREHGAGQSYLVQHWGSRTRSPGSRTASRASTTPTIGPSSTRWSSSPTGSSSTASSRTRSTSSSTRAASSSASTSTRASSPTRLRASRRGSSSPRCRSSRSSSTGSASCPPAATR
jgi:type I restriction enzyme R subunit